MWRSPRAQGLLRPAPPEGKQGQSAGGVWSELEKASPEKRAETTRKLVVVTAWAGETTTLPEDPSTVPSIHEIA